MLRRLHSRIIGMGSVCGLPPSATAEVFLKTLPPPSEVDPAKYERFKREEEAARGRPASDAVHAPEPFYDFTAAAAGHKHVALLTREGHLVTFGDNHYGQTAAPGGADKLDEGTSADSPHRGGGGGGGVPGGRRVTSSLSDWSPLYVDMDGAFAPREGTRNAVVCGANYTLVYQQGGRRAIAFGNNHMGQLGAGEKKRVNVEKGFVEWDPNAAWWPDSHSVIARVTGSFNHNFLELSNGDLFAFGSNTWGELGLGSTTSPMTPAPVTFFRDKGLRVKQVAAGNSFSLFLTEEGRVYGCGATNYGQLPPNTFEPAAVPLTRSFVVPSASSSASTTRRRARAGGEQKLIRIHDIACAGNLAVYVSTRSEIFVQGALPAFGVSVPSPRLQEVDQGPAIAALRERLAAALPSSHTGGAGGDDDGFVVEAVLGGPSTVVVRYRNGCLAALGANTEGQLHNVTKVFNGREVNLAPTFTATELLPTAVCVRADAARDRAWCSAGKGFLLLFDHEEAYPLAEQVAPIELPPGNSSARSSSRPVRPAAGSAAAASQASRPSSSSSPSRQEKLRRALK